MFLLNVEMSLSIKILVVFSLFRIYCKMPVGSHVFVGGVDLIGVFGILLGFCNCFSCLFTSVSDPNSVFAKFSNKMFLFDHRRDNCREVMKS